MSRNTFAVVAQQHATAALKIIDRRVGWLEHILRHPQASTQPSAPAWSAFCARTRQFAPTLISQHLRAARRSAALLEAIVLHRLDIPSVDFDVLMAGAQHPHNNLKSQSVAKAFTSAKNALRFAFDYRCLEDHHRHALIKAYDERVCPLCDEHSIRLIYHQDDSVARAPDIDHWHSKEQHPALQLSIANLIPACQTCNVLKSSTHFFDGQHHYSITDGALAQQLRHTLTVRKVASTSHDLQYEVLITSKRPDTAGTRAMNTASVLKLAKRYGRHQEMLDDLVHRARICARLDEGAYGDLAHRLRVSTGHLTALIRGRPTGSGPHLLQRLRNDITTQLSSS